MTTASIAALDQMELLKLALDASRNSNHGAALAYLKEAVSRTDATATVHHLLGAEYAQIQMMDRAIVEMEAALALDSTLSTARLQLGLLLMGTGANAAARALAVLQPLDGLHADDALRYFGQGLSLLIRDEYQNAITLLIKGMELNASNAALNIDMQKIITEIGKLPQEVLNKSRDTDGLPEDPSARHIFLSAYTGSRNQ